MRIEPLSNCERNFILESFTTGKVCLDLKIEFDLCLTVKMLQKFLRFGEILKKVYLIVGQLVFFVWE